MGQASTADREGFWRERVAGWKRSRVSLRIDSERHGLKAGTLGVWSFKLKDRTVAPDETAVQQEQAADMPFVPVGVVETAEATPTVTAEWMELQGSRMKDCDPLHGPVRKKPQLAKPRFDRPMPYWSERIPV